MIDRHTPGHFAPMSYIQSWCTNERSRLRVRHSMHTCVTLPQLHNRSPLSKDRFLPLEQTLNPLNPPEIKRPKQACLNYV